MAKLYQITVRWDVMPTEAKWTSVESKLGQFGNWLRFSSWTWLLSSDHDTVPIRDALRTVLDPKDYFLILEVSKTQADGWAMPWIWEWIRTKQS